MQNCKIVTITGHSMFTDVICSSFMRSNRENESRQAFMPL
jgi:hypothetical protein